MITLASRISLSLPSVLDLAFPKSQPRLHYVLPLHSPLHSGVSRLKGYAASISSQRLAFLPSHSHIPKSYFTPLCASVRACGMTPSFWSQSPCQDRPSGGCSRAAIPSPHPFLARPTEGTEAQISTLDQTVSVGLN